MIKLFDITGTKYFGFRVYGAANDVVGKNMRKGDLL